MIAALAAPPVSFGQPFALAPVNYGFTFSIYSQANLPALASPPLAPPSLSLRAAIDEVLAAKAHAGLRPHSIHVLRSILNQFAQGREAAPLASVCAKDIEDWLASRKINAWTKKSNISRLSTLFSYHIRRANLVSNPCKRLERIKVDHRAPLILSPAQADTLLLHTPAKFRPYVILGLFAGIRPEECQKLTWQDICLETNTVTVNLAKTRRRRIVPLERRAAALLKKYARRIGDIAPSQSVVRRFKRHVRLALGFDSWPQDLLRHTAASYLIALLGDVGKVAARLGNSSSVLLTHYHQPVKQADCEKFWSVKPCPPAPRWTLPPVRKYDYKAIRDFHSACRSYKKTREHFGISNSATLHYILKPRR